MSYIKKRYWAMVLFILPALFSNRSIHRVSVYSKHYLFFYGLGWHFPERPVCRV